MPVVAISRQVGSFGDEIAGLIAEALGCRLADSAVIRQLAESCDPGFKKACSLFEREVPGRFWERYFLNDPAYASLFESLNFELASRDNIVILGRGAQVVLGRTPGVFKVRIVAPIKIRAQRIAAREGMSLEDAEEFAERFGHQRRALVQQMYNVDLSDWALYDMIVNTADITPQSVAAGICASVRNMPPIPDDAALRESLKRQAFAKLVESAVRKKVTPSPHRSLDVTCPAPGKVVLAGVVSEKGAKAKAQDIARGYEGVQEVENLIKVASLSF